MSRRYAFSFMCARVLPLYTRSAYIWLDRLTSVWTNFYSDVKHLHSISRKGDVSKLSMHFQELNFAGFAFSSSKISST
jgi:hypothetical protein